MGVIRRYIAFNFTIYSSSSYESGRSNISVNPKTAPLSLNPLGMKYILGDFRRWKTEEHSISSLAGFLKSFILSFTDITSLSGLYDRDKN